MNNGKGVEVSDGPIRSEKLGIAETVTDCDREGKGELEEECVAEFEAVGDSVID